MSAESITKIISLTILSIVLIIFSYLFSQTETNVSIILLFIAIILALTVAAGYVKSNKSGK